MIGRLKDLTFGRGGEQILTIAVKADVCEMFDELKDYDLDIDPSGHATPTTTAGRFVRKSRTSLPIRMSAKQRTRSTAKLFGASACTEISQT